MKKPHARQHGAKVDGLGKSLVFRLFICRKYSQSTVKEIFREHQVWIIGRISIGVISKHSIMCNSFFWCKQAQIKLLKNAKAATCLTVITNESAQRLSQREGERIYTICEASG
jgi:hypothetical protein